MINKKCIDLNNQIKKQRVRQKINQKLDIRPCCMRGYILNYYKNKKAV